MGRTRARGRPSSIGAYNVRCQLKVPQVTTDRPIRADPRTPLWRERVLRAGLAHADASGLETFTMRGLAESLGVAPMSLYRHVANKDDLVDGIVDLVFAEIALPSGEGDWSSAMRGRAIAVRQALLRHPWAIGLMSSRRRPGPATLRHYDAVIGRLRQAGFTLAMAAHAYSLMDSYIYGFALQQSTLPSDPSMEMHELAAVMAEQFPADEYPWLAEFTLQHVTRPGYAFGDEFEYGLDVILGGLEAAQGSA